MVFIRPKDEPAATAVSLGDIFLIDGPTYVRGLAATVVPLRDASGNVSINNVFEGYATTATAGATTTLSSASAGQQFFTGTANQTVVLPDVTTLKLGVDFLIQNNSTGTLTVNSSGGGLVKSIPAGDFAVLVCVAITGTTPASWRATYVSTTGGGGGTAITVNFDTRTAAIAASISGTVQGIQIFGYSAAGDGGAARYRKVVSLGSGMLGFQSADGAWWEIAENAINVDMAGAKGDGTTDDSVAIRAAITSVPRGGDLVFSSGKTYCVSQDGANLWCLYIQSPVNIRGTGGYTNIKPLSIGNTVSVIWIKGSTALEDRFTNVSGLFIGDPVTGTRSGLHGLVLETQSAGSYFRRITVEKNFFCPTTVTGARGIYCNNNATNNPNGGIYTSCIQNNTIGNGIHLSQSGDSIQIINNAIYGIGPGILVDLIANATGPYMRDNNIVSQGGAIKIDRAYGFVIDGGIFEPISGSSPSNGAIIDVNGGTSTVIGGLIQNVVFVPIGGSNVTKYIRIRNSQMIRCLMNEMPGTGITCHDIAGSLGCVVGKNIIGTGNTYIADDGGSQTAGVSFYVGNSGRPAFQNSWANTGGVLTTLRYYKDLSGMVHVEGYVSGGTLSTTVFTLPVGYRPSAYVANANSSVQVTAAGAVFCTSGSNVQQNMAVSFLAADEGHLFV